MPKQPQPWYRAQTDAWMVQVGGRRYVLAKGKRNRPAAHQAFHDLMAQRAKNPPPTAAEPTVASVIECYLDFAGGELGAASLALRQRYLQAFCEAEGWRLVRECLPFHLTAWLKQQTSWRSDWTIHTVVQMIQRPFNWAVRQRLIAANPFLGVTHRPGAPRRPITDAEFQALLRFSSGRSTRRRPSPGARFREVLIFLRFTGCRPGELCHLTWNDVQLKDGVLVLEQHKTSRTQRKPRPRTVELDPVVVKLLAHIRRRQESTEHVFLTYRKTPWNKESLNLRIRRMRARAGIPNDAKLYGIRHRFGTRAIVNGVDLKTLSVLMGHTTTRMTEHYVHLAGQRQHLAAAMRQANGRRPSA